MRQTVYIWLDDIREPPNPDWIWVKTTGEAYSYIYNRMHHHYSLVVSLDHDLGEKANTGYDLLNWIERDIRSGLYNSKFDIVFNIHSANPVGVENMRRAINSIYKYLGEQNGE